jgi:hypothetical protein
MIGVSREGIRMVGIVGKATRAGTGTWIEINKENPSPGSKSMESGDNYRFLLF